MIYSPTNIYINHTFNVCRAKVGLKILRFKALSPQQKRFSPQHTRGRSLQQSFGSFAGAVSDDVVMIGQSQAGVLLCVARCCRVLQSVAVWCSVVQRVLGCCRVLQCVAVCCSVLQCGAVWCSVVQCVVVCCSVF